VLTELARALGTASANDAPAGNPCLFVFAEREAIGHAYRALTRVPDLAAFYEA
jgi:hypothetical protein